MGRRVRKGQTTPTVGSQDPRVRARRFARKGEYRRAMLILREACYLGGEDPVVWALYGYQCTRVRKYEEALNAYGQAAWRRQREGDSARANVLNHLADALRRDSSTPEPAPVATKGRRARAVVARA